MGTTRRVSLFVLLCALAACAGGGAELGIDRATPPARVRIEAEDIVPLVRPEVAPPAPVAPAPQPPAPAPPPVVTPPPAAAPQARAAAAIGRRFTMAPYRGLGSWLDVYDWSASYTNGSPPAGVEAVDRMASAGVQTLYIQASKWDSPTDVVEQDRLMSLVDKAHSRGMLVVGWYLPTFEDPAGDLRRLVAVARLPIDGIAVDIESRKVADVNERNRRLVELSMALRAALPGEVIGAIPMEPVLMEDVNPAFWPGFPWRGLASSYDVWLSMSYWTNRRPDSQWRDAYVYTAANIDRMRHNLGWLDAPVHALGGIGDGTSIGDVQSMHRAASERGALGGSLYDYRTTADPLWEPLRSFRVEPR
jgi:hypothetical protein